MILLWWGLWSHETMNRRVYRNVLCGLQDRNGWVGGGGGGVCRGQWRSEWVGWWGEWLLRSHWEWSFITGCTVLVNVSWDQININEMHWRTEYWKLPTSFTRPKQYTINGAVMKQPIFNIIHTDINITTTWTTSRKTKKTKNIKHYT